MYIIIGGVLTPNHDNDVELISWRARYQSSDIVPTCIAWNINDIFASLSPAVTLSSTSSPLSLSSEAVAMTLIHEPIVWLPSVSLSPLYAIDGGSFVQLTGARSHEWLCIGGYTLPDGDSISTVVAYNVVTDQWSFDTPMHHKRALAAVAIMNRDTTAAITGTTAPPAVAVVESTLLYVFGGMKTMRDGDNMDTCEVYNPLTRTWTLLTAKMHHVRCYAAAIWIPHWRAFMICGGYRGEESTRSIELYSPATNTFTPLASSQWQLPEVDAGHTLQLNDNILVLVTASIRTNQPIEPGGWVIDLAPYATVDDVLNTRVPLKWQPLPLLPCNDDAGASFCITISSSFII